MLLVDGHNSQENDYDCTNVLMRYTQLPNHFPKGFWCPYGSSKVVVYGFICLVKWE